MTLRLDALQNYLIFHLNLKRRRNTQNSYLRSEQNRFNPFIKSCLKVRRPPTNFDLIPRAEIRDFLRLRSSRLRLVKYLDHWKIAARSNKHCRRTQDHVVAGTGCSSVLSLSSHSTSSILIPGFLQLASIFIHKKLHNNAIASKPHRNSDDVDNAKENQSLTNRKPALIATLFFYVVVGLYEEAVNYMLNCVRPFQTE